MENDDKFQQTPLQPAETAKKIANKASAYVMPGLCAPIVSAFRRRRGVIPTPRTIGVNMSPRPVEPAVVTTALIYELYEQLEDLRQIVSRRPVESETQSVRYQLPRLRRQA